ncbi:hypothetical protein [Shimazuella kribbensis]|uniref:hypothetical protein n=1 Tax=Shimazuella kribbensis TaxID=139808 RepID=UPI00040E5A4A|nr:hypothetical protein [Shimazuella kribbensis]
MNKKRLRLVVLFCLSVLFFSFLPLQSFATSQSSNKAELTIRQICRNDASRITIELQNHTNKEIAFDFKRVSDGKIFGEEGAVGPHQKFESPLPSKAEGEKWIVHTLTRDYPITIESLPKCLPTPVTPPELPPKKQVLEITQVCRVDQSTIALRIKNNSNEKITFTFKRVRDGEIFSQEPGAVSAHKKVLSPLPSTKTGEQWIVQTIDQDYPVTIKNLPTCKGGELPTTANNNLTWVVSGGSMIILGLCLFMYRRRLG